MQFIFYIIDTKYENTYGSNNLEQVKKAVYLDNTIVVLASTGERILPEFKRASIRKLEDSDLGEPLVD